MSEAFKASLRSALEDACTAQSMRAINRGRAAILALPRQEVLGVIYSVAAESLPLFEEWEFRRLLEVYEELDKALLQRLVTEGLASTNTDIREASNDFLARAGLA